MKPIWHSKRWMALAFTLIALVALQIAGAPGDVLMTLAGGLAVGLPVLLGAESWIDRARVTGETHRADGAQQNQLLSTAVQMGAEFIQLLTQKEEAPDLEKRLQRLEVDLGLRKPAWPEYLVRPVKPPFEQVQHHCGPTCPIHTAKTEEVIPASPAADLGVPG